nr:GNAT family N-acetyltransferase [uncultured Caproiciproducens sp.]
MEIRKGIKSDIEQLAQLYDDLNDYLNSNINYPGWIKGVYPVREDAVNGVSNGNLYVAEQNNIIAGSIILSHKPEAAYHQAKWNIDSAYSDIFVIHTFAVNPSYLKLGIGTQLLDFATQLSIIEHIKSIRLDVFENNIPAIRLYEKCGFKYVDTVDLGLGRYGLDHFKLYEKML